MECLNPKFSLNGDGAVSLESKSAFCHLAMFCWQAWSLQMSLRHYLKGPGNYIVFMNVIQDIAVHSCWYFWSLVFYYLARILLSLLKVVLWDTLSWLSTSKSALKQNYVKIEKNGIYCDLIGSLFQSVKWEEEKKDFS